MTWSTAKILQIMAKTTCENKPTELFTFLITWNSCIKLFKRILKAYYTFKIKKKVQNVPRPLTQKCISICIKLTMYVNSFKETGYFWL